MKKNKKNRDMRNKENVDKNVSNEETVENNDSKQINETDSSNSSNTSITDENTSKSNENLKSNEGDSDTKDNSDDNHSKKEADKNEDSDDDSKNDAENKSDDDSKNDEENKSEEDSKNDEENKSEEDDKEKSNNNAAKASSLSAIANKLKSENNESSEKKESVENNEDKNNQDNGKDSSEQENNSNEKNDKNSDSGSNSEKKKSKLPIIIIIILLLLSSIYAGGVYYFKDKFLFGTSIRKVNVFNINEKDAVKKITNRFKNEKVSVELPDSKKIDVNYEKNGALLNPTDDVKKIFNSQNKYLWFIPDNNKYDLNSAVKIDNETALHSYANEISSHLPKVDLKSYVKFDEEKNNFKLKDIPNDKKLFILNDILLEITDSVKKGKTSIKIEPANKIKEQAQRLVDRVNKSISKDIPLSYGSENDTIDKKYISQMITISNNGVEVNEESLGKTLEEVSKKHQKITDSQLFSFNAQKLKKEIKSDIENTKLKNSYSAEKNVIPLGKNNGKGTLNLGGTYIEVNISAQTMYVWQSGKLVKTFNVITGDITKGRNTTIGVWNIWGKERNKVLSGSTVGVGKDYDYNIPVKYWMPIDDTGIGLHSIDVDDVSGDKGRVYWGSDAAFIGKGSHGCVNMHTDDAGWVFDNMALFTKVYVTP